MAGGVTAVRCSRLKWHLGERCQMNDFNDLHSV